MELFSKQVQTHYAFMQHTSRGYLCKWKFSLKLKVFLKERKTTTMTTTVYPAWKTVFIFDYFRFNFHRNLSIIKHFIVISTGGSPKIFIVSLQQWAQQMCVYFFVVFQLRVAWYVHFIRCSVQPGMQMWSIVNWPKLTGLQVASF